jgi:uncharacterized membrane protein YphA (DoxX/SURF4 family)
MKALNEEPSRKSKIIYWLTTTIVALIFLVTGIGNLLPFDHIAHDMSHIGYPPYFLKILGAWKILGAAAIILPVPTRFKEWAYAGMLFDLTGASFSRFAVGDDLLMVFIPLAIAVLVLVSYIYSNQEKQLKKR